METQFEVVKRPDDVGRGVCDDPLVTALMKTMTNGKAVRVQHYDGGSMPCGQDFTRRCVCGVACCGPNRTETTGSSGW